MSKAIKPIGNGIIFQFEDKVTKGLFGAESEAGLFIAPSYTESGQESRWAYAVAVGPKTSIVKKGDRILIQPLRWTTELKFGDVPLWKTDEDQVIMVDNK
jgi:hypothetical protein